LYGLQLFGIKVGLNNIRRLTSAVGHPEKKFPSIHIAGTNGKGSTAAMIASVLTASGYKTGLYTSPHLRHFSERIRINGKKIPEREIIRYTALLRPIIEKTKATFFEATTAIACMYFADQDVDIAVIETGLGGRLDATNIIHPELSIITTIGLDHTEYLGSTLQSVAREKGGIIKQGVPCVTGVVQGSALRVLQKIAETRKSVLIQPKNEYPFSTRNESLGGFHLSIHNGQNILRDVFISLAGSHQASNALLALSALEYMKDQRGYSRINNSAVNDGLGHVREYSGIRGRLDVLSNHPLIVADVAHNADGIRSMVNALRPLTVGKCMVMFGVMKDKDYKAMIRHLIPLTRLAVVVHPQTERAREIESLAGEFHRYSAKAIAVSSVKEGIKIGLREQRKNEPFLIVGSHFVVGEAMENLRIQV
jgi:dihydrofolate synthase/folylpolyglutamate synthase